MVEVMIVLSPVEQEVLGRLCRQMGKQERVAAKAVTNQRLSYEQVIPLGDALRTVHFSIESGIRLVLEEATLPPHPKPP